MSIYVVYLASWFPSRGKNGKDPMHGTARMVVESSRCPKCNKKPSWKRAWGHHSIPWGNGDVFCSRRCALK